MASILFATNRRGTDARGVPGFLDVAATGPDGEPRAEGLLFGAATVDGIEIADARAGRVTAIGSLNAAAFDEDQLAPLLASPRDVLVFIHGADNSFNDAIQRAAYNQAWLAAGDDTTRFDVIAFTWPARSYGQAQLFGAANLIGDLADYRHDQQQAERSAFHLALFLEQMAALRPQLGARRLHLLCHSMGNYALAGAVEYLFARDVPPETPIFDRVLLAAADEQADSFLLHDGKRFAYLQRIGRTIAAYASRDDILMTASRWANGSVRLGFAGPAHKTDTALFRPDTYTFIDCSGLVDSQGHALLDSHQYYRESPTVRADILAVLAGRAAAAMPGRRYDPAANLYALAPPPPGAAIPQPASGGRAGGPKGNG